MRIVIAYSLQLAVITALGCRASEAERVPVMGRVQVDGRPLASGVIRFVPESGRPASSAILADGSFNLALESVGQRSEPGIPRGVYRVQVSSSKILSDESMEWNVAKKYADFRTSGLVVTIDGPNENLAIDLTWAGEQQPGQYEQRGKDAGQQATTEMSAKPANDVMLQNSEGESVSRESSAK